MDPLQLLLEEQVRIRYPDLAFTFMLSAVSPDYIDAVDARSFASAVSRAARETYTDGDPPWEQQPVAQRYIEFYGSMGLNGRKCSNPVRQAYRFRASEYRPKVRILDAAMLAEYATGISFQLYDAAKLGSDLRICLPNAPMTHIEHTGKVGQSKPGELAMCSSVGLIHCPSLGNSSLAPLSTNTRWAVVRIMKIPGIEVAKLRRAIDLFTAHASVVGLRYLTAKDPQAILQEGAFDDATSPSAATDAACGTTQTEG